MGIIPVVWFSLLITPYLSDGIYGVINNSNNILNNVFNIKICDDSLKVTLICALIYLITIGVYFAGEKNYRPREEHGSARWEEPTIINSKYAGKNNEGKVLTQNVSIGFECKKHRRNLNVLICGGSGSGKTRFYVKPNIMQKNSSLVILDPKGELVGSMSGFLNNNGYKVKIINLINMDKSDSYNPFCYLRDDNDIIKLATNIFQNTTPDGSKSSDPFWDQAGMMLLLSLMFYLHYECPIYERNFPQLMKLIRKGYIKGDREDSESELDRVFAALERQKPEHVAVKYYKNYHSGSAVTLKSIQISLVARLEKFNLDTLAGITKTDSMELDRLGEEKMAVFAVIPDNDSSLNFIVGMLYTQLFQQLYYQADVVHKGEGVPVHVHFLMDEFANVAMPSEFDKILSTMRSRNLSVSIIIQNLAQLKARFPKEWESVVGNCDEFLYLGGNEKQTHDYLSGLLGNETIDVNSFGKNHGSRGSYTTNYTTISRNLLMADEIRRLDNDYCILLIRGEYPVLDRKFDICKHVNYAYIGDGENNDAEYKVSKNEIGSIVIVDSYNEEFFEKENEEEYTIINSDEINKILEIDGSMLKELSIGVNNTSQSIGMGK